MVATYNILGRQIGSHYLALATLGTTFAIAGFSMRGGEKKEANPKPPINAQSKEEEQFIQDFIKNMNAEEQKAKH